jgi:site-specific DNA-methyltransferase (adenine-specific)
MVFAGCPEGGTVLDPFAGSGTVGVVALNNNRNFIGIDLNESYLDIARGRIFSEVSIQERGDMPECGNSATK